ncbi:MAG TPA: STAS domain-containing protein, partial [Acidobacteriota bacterium]|nr:STAS domain-containing protein [Acidobacteriota bacterium]
DLIDSSGVGAIVSLFKRVRTLQGDVKIARLRGQPAEIFKLLRLDRAFPKKIIEDATSKQMLVRLKARMRREEQVEKPSFWKSLFNFQSSPQMGMALAVLAVLVLAVIAAPVLTSTTGTATGTASSSTSLPIVAGMVVLLLLALYWFGRKK